MRLPLEFHPAVRAEVDAAHDWYQQRRPGLGSEFLDEVQHVLAQISDNPERCGVLAADVRAARLPRFPYAIYYRVLVDRIRVLAIYHTARDPAGWQTRS